MADPPRAAPLSVGPYELLEHVASGGMAEVYVARRQGPHGFNKTVAVKRILPQLARDEEFVAMFVGEARVAATLSHPNIVHVFDFGEENGELYMAMEYVRGTNVSRLTRQAAARNTVIPLDICLHVLLSVLRGLEYAHAARDESGARLNLVHRDVSPANVLVDSSGTVKLTDFGIARAATVERRTVAGHLKGKLGYMSPEQVMGHELDARSDLFTLAIVFAELLTLRPLFAAPSELEILTRIRDADIGGLDACALSADVHAMLRRALARSPSDRYASATAFAEDVEALARKRGMLLSASRLANWVANMDRESFVPPALPEEETSILAGVEDPEEWRDDRVTPPLAMYKVKTSDGVVRGPLHYHELAELFATGRVGLGCVVSRDDGPFEPPREFPELLRFFSSSSLGWESWNRRSRKTIERALLPSWLVRLALARKTGAILLSDQKRRKKVFLVDGAPEFAASTEKSELLGEYLISKGRVLRVEVEMALSILPRFGGRLGDALVGLGVVRPVELVRAIHEQTVERYLELFRWREGEIAFDPGASSGEETFPLGVAPLDLVAQGVRESYPTDEIRAWLVSLGPSPLAHAPTPPMRFEAVRWADGEERVLSALDRSRPMAGFLREQTARRDVTPSEAVRAIFLGLSFGLLTAPGFVVSDLP